MHVTNNSGGGDWRWSAFDPFPFRSEWSGHQDGSIVDVSACRPDLLGDLDGRKSALLVENVSDRPADCLARLASNGLGELTAKPRAPLALRFGPELGRRLDQAMGRLSEPIDPVRPPDLIEVRRIFAEPIGATETLARYTGKLCEALEAKGLGARQLDLLFHRIDNRIEAIRIGTARPVRDVKRLTRLLCDKIETVGRGSASRSCAWPRRSPCLWRRNR